MAVGSRCKGRGCGELIVYMRTAAGGRIPVNLTSCTVDDDENTVFDPGRHVSHFRTCPAANEYSKRKGRK